MISPRPESGHLTTMLTRVPNLTTMLVTTVLYWWRLCCIGDDCIMWHSLCLLGFWFLYVQSTTLHTEPQNVLEFIWRWQFVKFMWGTSNLEIERYVRHSTESGLNLVIWREPTLNKPTFCNTLNDWYRWVFITVIYAERRCPSITISVTVAYVVYERTCYDYHYRGWHGIELLPSVRT